MCGIIYVVSILRRRLILVGVAMEKKYDKLIRDNIPEIITSQGKKPVTRVLTNEEYKQYLSKKLQEEVDEFMEDTCIDELCDILEVLEAISEVMGFSETQIKEAKKQKADKNGSFSKRLCLEKVTY